jgi:phosphoesterase RecJ-like protein
MFLTAADPRLRRAGAFLLQEAHDRVLLASHVNMDGDGMGACLLLARALRQLGRNASVVAMEPVPPRYGMLPDLDQVIRMDREGAGPPCDLLVVCDCADQRLLAGLPELLAPGYHVLNIDHHVSNKLYGDVNCVVTDACACTEVAFRLIETLDVELDYDMAMAIYVGIVLDTGNFTLRSTTPQAHAIAAEMLTFDIDPVSVYQQLFRGKHIGYMRLAAEVMHTLSQSACSRLAWGKITRRQLRSNGVQQHETDDLIDTPRALRGVQVSMLLREIEAGRRTRVSLRSEVDLDLDDFVRQFDGGGHHRSAGCVLPLGLDDAEVLLVPQLLELLDTHEATRA